MYEKWLKAFHMVATQGGFTAAARTLNVGQPTISTHIKALEDYFRVELFYRRSRTIELTDTGRALREITQGLYGHEAEAISFLRSVAQMDRGQLRLGAVGPHDVIELVDAFRRQHPRIELAVNVAPRRDILARLTGLEVDVGIFSDDVASTDVHSSLYCRHQVLVAVPNSHRLAQRASVRIAELRDEPVILRDAPAATRRAADHALSKAKVRVRPIMEINSRESVREAIARGIGIGFVSAREFAPHPDVRLLRVSDMAIETASYVACLAVRRQRPLIKAFMTMAQAMAQPRPAQLPGGARSLGRYRGR
ncbi:MAG: LysR family transcriptional regulator [Alphaproteobacteria bacterium]|nr:LysR family transcriptional regulator [Alphaproteobacteria bacterium]